jgi:hypothetical protein
VKGIEAVLKEWAPVDTLVVSVGGDSAFKPYQTLNDDDFRFGAERKLVAQFRLVRLAKQFLID